MNSLGSCISTFGKCKKFNPQNELGNFLDFYFLTTFALWKFGNFLTLPNAELVHNDIYQKIQFNANFSIKLHNYENHNDAHFRLSRSNLFGLGDLTKISLYYFWYLCKFYRPIVNFNKLWFFAQNLRKSKL